MFEITSCVCLVSDFLKEITGKHSGYKLASYLPAFCSLETDFLSMSVTTGPTCIFSGVSQEPEYLLKAVSRSSLAFPSLRDPLSVV